MCGYEFRYFVSKKGEVFKLLEDETLQKLSLFKTSKGYLTCHLRGVEKDKVVKVHRLVAGAFLDNPENKPIVHHIDGVRHNNKLSNLQWATHKENTQACIEAGNFNFSPKGSTNWNCKLSEKDIEYICRNFKSRCRKFGSVALGKKFGVDRKRITAHYENHKHKYAIA